MYIIAYPAGCYGNFIGFTLDWMQGNYAVDYRPFTKKNSSHSHSSHNWNGHWHRNVYEAVLNPKENSHVHPISEESESSPATKIVPSIEKLLTVYDKVIVPYPALDDFLWTCNNKLTKVYGSADSWRDKMRKHIDHNLSTKWESLDNWEYREFLSLWLYDQHMSETGYKDIVDYENSKVFKIQVNQIRDDFNNTFNKLSKWLQIENVRSDDDLTKLHKDWIQNEPYLYKDKLIENIVDAIINNVDIPMNECSIFDQADIQRRLRNAGYEIKCYGLNEWPSTTKQLRELIYEAE
jgi:hypothetical protein